MITELIIVLLVIIFLTWETIIIAKYVFPYLNDKNEIKKRELRLETNKLYTTIDPELVERSVLDYITGYINRYILYKFKSNRIDYIKQDEIDLMIKDVSKAILKDMSEMYLEYIRLLQSIETDEDLIKFVHNKVMQVSIQIVSEYNKPNE